MVGVGALVALLLLFAFPSLGPLPIVLAVNLYLWRRRAAIVREQRARQGLRSSPSRGTPRA
jgi:hypothetical protein